MPGPDGGGGGAGSSPGGLSVCARSCSVAPHHSATPTQASLPFPRTADHGYQRGETTLGVEQEPQGGGVPSLHLQERSAVLLINWLLDHNQFIDTPVNWSNSARVPAGHLIV